MSRATGFPTEVRDLVYTRAAGCCERCGERTGDLQYHHRRPRGMGGSRRKDTNVASNCLLLCQMCHGVIENHRQQALNLGQLVRSGQSPIATPVLHRGSWVLLDDDGYMWNIPTPENSDVAVEKGLK